MHQVTGCSTLENLAAFAEGRLRGAERERVIDHLVGCADCREVLAESLETTEDLEAEDVPSPVDEHVGDEWRPPVTPRRGPLAQALEEQLPTTTARRPPYSRWLARTASLAAAALVAVGAVVMWQASSRRAPPDRSEWLAAMPPAQQLADHVWGGVVMRGAGAGADQARQATEIGALLVDVDVALAAGGDRVSDFLHRIATLCEDAGYMDHCVSELRAIAQSGDAATMKEKLAAFSPQLERDLRDRFDGFFLDLGTFLEEAQLAARSGRGDFLDTPEARRYLDRVLSQDRPKLADALLDRWEAGDAEALRNDREIRREMLEPVRDELLVLRDAKASSQARADAAQQVLEALTG